MSKREHMKTNMKCECPYTKQCNGAEHIICSKKLKQKKLEVKNVKTYQTSDNHRSNTNQKLY